MTIGNHLAFPADPQKVSHDSTGMTKREYIAAKFAAAIVSSISSEAEHHRIRYFAEIKQITVFEWIANNALKQTDALIKALNNNP